MHLILRGERTYSKREFFLFNSAIGALIISFLAESLSLKVIYSMMFFGGTYYLQLLLFLDKDASIGVSMNTRKVRSLYVYMLGFLLGLCILFLPPHDVPPTSQPFYVAFMAIPIASFIRVVFGYFLLGVFPGLMFFDIFLPKHKFDIVEKIGLTLALSYTFNTFIGALLIAISPEFLNSLTFITVMLGSLALMKFIRLTIFKIDDSKVKGEGVHLIGKPTKMILLFSSLLLILSSYTLVFSSDVRDSALSGDITGYISFSNEQKLGYTPLYLTDRPLFYIFILVASTLTGLHAFYAYVGLQFYLILFPASFYTLLKALFPNNGKISATGAFLSSTTSGLGFIGLWDFYTTYHQSGSVGRFQALMNASAKAPLSYVPYQFYVMPLAYSILFLALAYLYRSIYPMNGKTEISDIMLCGLLASTLPFTHSIFEFSFFMLSLMILSVYALLKERFKVLLTIAGVTLTFFIPFELTTKTYWYTFTYYLFHIEHFFGHPNPIPTLFSIIMLTIVFIVTVCVIALKMSRPLTFPTRFLSIPSFYKVPIKILTWISAFTIFIATLYYWRINWATSYYPQNLDWPPWYIILLSYGFYLPLTIGMLPIIISVSKNNRRACLFLTVSAFSISISICLSLFLPLFFTPLTWSRRWSFFAIYFLIITTAIGLSNLPIHLQEIVIRMKLRLKVVKSEVKLPVGQCALSLLILMLALSNLTALYAVEVFYTSATVQNVISNAETDALTWLYYNTPANAVILTFSDSSAKAVSAIAARKTLSYSDASSSWPLQLLFNSRLPEVTLYSLKNLGVTHIFVGERDIPILSSKLKDSYLNNLLPALPIVYQKNGFTIYNIPEYMLSNDSNYISFLVPKNLYKFLKVNDIPTLLELKDIFNYIYVYDSPVILNGSCILTSDYILMAVDQLKVIELESSSSMHNLYLKDMNITDVHLNGLVDLSIEASRLVLPSSYEGVITTLNLPNKFTVHVKLINAELKFKIGDNSSQQMRMTDGSIKMTVENSGSSTFKVAVRQPIINVNGVINLSSWHGIFWYKESAVVSFCLHSADIDGELTLQLTYTFGGYIFKILSVERINSVKWRS